MTKSWFHRLFRSSSSVVGLSKVVEPRDANEPITLYVVTGEQINAFTEPAYPTHPDVYLFPYDSEELLPESPSVLPPDPFSLPIGTERETGPFVIKAFTKVEDAIDFAYCCNMVNVNPSVYSRVGGKWRYSDDQTAFDIDW